MRADRLLSVLLLLQNQGKMSTRQLARELEVSERTVTRDLEALSAAGIPVYAERGREGGWRLTEGYRTSLNGMKPREIASLLLAADRSVLEALGASEDFSAAALKLEASGAAGASTAGGFPPLSDRIYIDGTGWHPTGETCPWLGLLQQAVWEERLAEITYGQGASARKRIIAPLGLVVKRGVWYVVALTEDSLRTYRISRIAEASLREEHFRRPADFALIPYWEQSTAEFKSSLPRYPAVLLVKDAVLELLEQERYVRLVEVQAAESPGWRVAEAEFHTLDSACRIIFSFGSGLRAVSPPELVQRLVRELGETAALYEEIRNTIPE